MELNKAPDATPNIIELEIDDHHNQAINNRNMQDPLRYRKKTLFGLILTLIIIIILVNTTQDIIIAVILGSSENSCDNSER